MIDLKQLRENPARFALGAKEKGIHVDIERLLARDAERRTRAGHSEEAWSLPWLSRGQVTGCSRGVPAKRPLMGKL